MTRIVPILFFLLSIQSLIAQENFDEYTLPLLIIRTNYIEIPQEPKVTATLKVINNPSGINKPTDPATGYNGQIGIELRGSSSQLFPKKPYGFETRNTDGSNNNVALLGLPKENDWVLHGPFSDKTLMRNALAYHFANQLMDYAPRTVFCEVILQNQYQGVYILTEKIKRDNDRVDINRLTPEDNSGDALTGGFILKIDKSDGGGSDGFPSKISALPGQFKEIGIQYHYPKPFEITSVQKNYIQNYFHKFESTLNGEDWLDPMEGYKKYVDINTFVDYQIINELSKNVDGYRISTIFHKDRDSIDGRFKMGPVWDYNLGFGNADYCTQGNPEGWVTSFNTICPNDFWVIPFWWKKMGQDLDYQNALKDRWTDLRANEFSDERVLWTVDSMRQIIGSAADRNFSLYPILGEYIWPNYFVGDTYEAEIDHLKDWLLQRMEWMDGAMENLGAPPFDPNAEFSLEVYPNPTASEFLIEYYAYSFERFRIYIFNNLGQIKKFINNDKHPSGIQQHVIDVEDYGPGIYHYGVWKGVKLKESGSIQIN